MATASDLSSLPAPSASSLSESEIVIIGGTGDLALRKIFPALFWRYLDGQITPGYRLFAASRSNIDIGEFAHQLRPYCESSFEKGAATNTHWKDFLKLIQLVHLDIVSGDGVEELANLLLEKAKPERPCIFYLAIGSDLFGAACRNLKAAGCALPQSRVVIEKPLGHDKASAQAINNEILEIFCEDQIYRIDHYLGKETVQNLMALRFANTLFESQWSNRYVDHVQITVAETIGVATRAGYYDAYGAVRDMVQNHLLQLVCLVAMEPPARFNADQVRNEKLRVLNALRMPKPEDVCCGQYKGYTSEIGHESNTETFIALRLELENWRWAGVPFYIRTGKRLTSHASEIVVTFKDRPHDIFAKPEQSPTRTEPNRLIVRLQPSEGLRLQLISKKPGPGGMRLFNSELNLTFDEAFDERLPDAYERLLMDTVRGNQTLFMRNDEVLAAWEFIDPVLEIMAHQEPLLYREGSMGPMDEILTRDGRAWIDPAPEEDAPQ